MIIPEPIQLSDQERIRLEGMANSTNTTLSKRARIILCCAEGKNNTEVSRSLMVNAETVSIWRKKYIQYGLPALTESFMGVKPKTPYEEIDEAIGTLLRNGTEGYTITKIADVTGYSYRQVSDSIIRLGLSLSRKHHWEFFTMDQTIINRSAILAVYLSESLSVVFTAKAPWGFSTSFGQFLTFNKKTAEDIHLVKHNVMLGHVLSASTNRLVTKSMNRGPSVFQKVNELLTSLPEYPSLTYHLFSLCESLPSYTGERPDDFTMDWFPTRKEWLLAIHDWIGQNSSGYELLQIERLEKGIEKFLDKSTSKTDVFFWDRSIMAVGTEASPIQSEDESEADVLLDIVKNQIPESDYPSEADDLTVVFLPFVFDKDGGAYRVVSTDKKIKASSFSMEIPKGLLNGVNESEMPVARLRDEAGRIAYELLVEFVKKKNPNI